MQKTSSVDLKEYLKRHSLPDIQEIALFQRAVQVKLPFKPMPSLIPNLSWSNKVPLYILAHLQRGSLSGPVQKDKADVYDILRKLIGVEQTKQKFNIQQITGFYNFFMEDSSSSLLSLEEYVRIYYNPKNNIISSSDFNAKLSSFLEDVSVLELFSASWYQNKFYWKGDTDYNQIIANLVVYARRREIISIQEAVVNHYSLNLDVLENLSSQYQIISMPQEAWSDVYFMKILLDTEISYSRVPLRIKSVKNAEWLFLPNSNLKSYALGIGLKLSGAYDVSNYLRSLGNMQNDTDLIY